MRVALRLLSSLPTWNPYKASTISTRPAPRSDRRTIQSHSHTQAAVSQTWNLEDLWRVSEETGPFVIHLSSNDPYLNLSIEHFLLLKSHPESRILLFYTNRPCVVIGRNQNPWLEADLKRIKEGFSTEEQVLEVFQRAGGEKSVETGTKMLQSGIDNNRQEVVPIDMVRRRSGGGTVFHDNGNLNYSVIVPNTSAFKRHTHAEMVVQALQELKTTQLQSRPPTEPRYGFDVVRVNDRNDILMRKPGENEWLKVSGSAFKLTRGRALHHGTLLYSSPYLHRISDLLRSPGQGLIHAKGVESVRSKVGNLAWTADPEERAVIGKQITAAIVRQFWSMYGKPDELDLHKTEGKDGCSDSQEIRLALPTSEEELEAQNQLIAQGVAELTSPSWLFDQTPKFDFTSGVLEDHRVDFSAAKASITSLKVSSGDSVSEEGFGGAIAAESVDTKIYAVNDWKALLPNIPTVLARRLGAIFPKYEQKVDAED